MQDKHLKLSLGSQGIISNKPQDKTEPDPKNPQDKIDRLVKQLEQVQYIATSGFWLSTDELAILLNLENGFIDIINAEVKNTEVKSQSYKFLWRNFECVLMERQLDLCFWALKNRPVILQNTDINPARSSDKKIVSLVSNQNSQLKNLQLDVSLDTEEILTSPYAVINDFLSATQLNDLLRYSINKQPEFVPTTNSAQDPNYRRSFYLPHFPGFSDMIVKMVRKIAPQIIAHLDINNFAIGQIESQMTAHNHGNYYKIHNDNGSLDCASRVLTYVFYYHREPKAFTGGELVIYDSKIENGYTVAAESHKVIQPTNNTIVFFPSQCMHEVRPVSCPSEYFADSRFTINGWLRHVN